VLDIVDLIETLDCEQLRSARTGERRGPEQVYSLNTSVLKDLAVLVLGLVQAPAGFMLFVCGLTLYVAAHPSNAPVAYVFVGMRLEIFTRATIEVILGILV
jgi:hypothetical protein